MNNPTGPDATHLVEVVTTYVEMLTPDMLVPSPATDLDIIEAELPCPELNRFLYAAVGGHWYWVDRLGWRYDKWLDYVDCDTMHTCVGYVRGTPAGYFEAELQTDADVEIRSFGLLPQFLGRGYGGDLLTRAIRFAWRLGAGGCGCTRVVLTVRAVYKTTSPADSRSIERLVKSSACRALHPARGLTAATQVSPLLLAGNCPTQFHRGSSVQAKSSSVFNRFWSIAQSRSCRRPVHRAVARLAGSTNRGRATTVGQRASRR